MRSPSSLFLSARERLARLASSARGGRDRAPAAGHASWFDGSASYWEKRYSTGGNSGAGSYSHLAEFKADVINKFVSRNAIKSAIEFGAGDGNQLSLFRIEQYTGVDVSPSAVANLRQRFANDGTKRFFLASEADFGGHAELSLSLDVIFHLVEDGVFAEYMENLFVAATRYVIIYSSNSEIPDRGAHVRHRCFSELVERRFPEWSLIETIVNPYKGETHCDFYIYECRVAENASAPR